MLYHFIFHPTRSFKHVTGAECFDDNQKYTGMLYDNEYHFWIHQEDWCACCHTIMWKRLENAGWKQIK